MLSLPPGGCCKVQNAYKVFSIGLGRVSSQEMWVVIAITITEKY